MEGVAPVCLRPQGSHRHAPPPGVPAPAPLLLLVVAGAGAGPSCRGVAAPPTSVDRVEMLSSGVGVYRFPLHRLQQNIS